MVIPHDSAKTCCARTMTFGTTTSTAPDTLDSAGSPMRKANSPLYDRMPQEAITDRTERAVCGDSTYADTRTAIGDQHPA